MKNLVICYINRDKNNSYVDDVDDDNAIELMLKDC